MRVLGIDPGMAICGYGVAVQEPGRGPFALAFGAIRAEGLPPDQQLLKIHGALAALLAEHRPDAVAVERLFFTRNVQTAIGVGQARGVALLAAAQAGLPLREFTPTEVKMATAGYGRADKRQMQAMVAALLGLPAVPQPDDAADALAVALCCLQGEAMRERLGPAVRLPRQAPARTGAARQPAAAARGAHLAPAGAATGSMPRLPRPAPSQSAAPAPVPEASEPSPASPASSQAATRARAGRPAPAAGDGA